MTTFPIISKRETPLPSKLAQRWRSTNIETNVNKPATHFVEDAYGIGENIIPGNPRDDKTYEFLGMNGQCMAVSIEFAKFINAEEIVIIWEQEQHSSTNYNTHLIHCFAVKGETWFDINGANNIEATKKEIAAIHGNLAYEYIAITDTQTIEIIENGYLSRQNYPLARDYIERYFEFN